MKSAKHADIRLSFCADSNEQCDRRDNILIFGVEDEIDEDVYERVVEVANDIGVTVSKQDITVCHHLPSRNPRSRSNIAKIVRRETKFRIKTRKRNFKNSIKKLSFDGDVTLLQTKLVEALRRRPDVKYVDMFNKKVVLTLSNGKKHFLKNLVDLRKWDMDFVDSVSKEFRHFW